MAHSDDEQNASRDRAVEEWISMQDTARRTICDYVARTEHRARVAAAADVITDEHADALDRLGS